MKTFQELFNGLNDAQKKAVESTEGPIMVIAGPGTGKTQILGARIAKIIHDGLSNPANILCLTYTDAGAVAMRNRLVSMIGPLAYQVNIFTYHGFCNKVIQENYAHFGVDDLEAISDLEEVLLFRQLIDSFDEHHPLKRWKNSTYADAKRLKNLFEVIKKENWTPEFIVAACEEEIEFQRTHPDNLYKKATKEFKAGDLKIKEFSAIVASYESTMAAAKEFPHYALMMREAGRYTYEDMIQWVIKAFDSVPELLDKYQSNYNYILVDEFQDTNGSQNKIIDQLTSYWAHESNIFVVGDDDQSIYRFQGANVENIEAFYDKYLTPYPLEERKDRVIVLTENYRSSQIILDVAQSLIAINEERLTKQFPALALDKSLLAKGDTALEKTPVEIIEYDATIAESMGIGQRIVSLVNGGVSPNDIAVIYRNHAQSDNLIKFLKNNHIHVKTKRTENVLDNVITNRIFDILQYLSEETVFGFSREDLLIRILHFPFFRLTPREIITFFFKYRKNKKTLSYASLRYYCLSDLEKFSDAEKAITVKVAMLEGWIAEKETITLQELFEKIINDTGLLAWVMEQEEKTAYLQELNALFTFVKEETHRHPTIYIKEFIETVQIMIKENIQVPWTKTNYIKEGVNFMTAHSSKGLEFDYVFIIGNEDDKWSPKDKNNQMFKLPSRILNKKEDLNKEEERRLMFVALTRAKKSLMLSYSLLNEKEKEKSKSQFITELVASAPSIYISHDKIQEEEQEKYLLTILQKVNKENPAMIETAYLEELLENYSLSVTHLDKYLKCPLSFYYDNLLRVPIAKKDSMAFGDAVHKTLQAVFEIMRRQLGEFPPVEMMLTEFEKKMLRQRESFTQDGYDKMLAYGKAMLPDFYQEKTKVWNQEVIMEESIKIYWNNISLNGKIDKVEFDGNTVKVVDYKTGSASNVQKYKSDARPASEEEKEKKRAASKEITHSDIYGGDYWRQAVFYKILIENDPNKDWQVAEALFEFTEKDKTKNIYPIIRIKVTPEDEHIVKEQILYTHQGIMNKQFDGCGKEDCEWCCFVNNKLVKKNR
jgi:DNA helicase-2/ATP-dependent DNA helicase PcrA